MGTEDALSVKVDASTLSRRFDQFPESLRRAIEPRIMGFAEELRAYAISTYMSGDPLHHRSGNLIKAMNIAPLKSTEKEISTTVGDNIEYARVHEEGGTFNIPAYMRHTSLRVAKALGYDVSMVKKGMKIESGMVRAHTATYPKRAFLAPSIADKQGDFVDAMDAAASEASGASNGTA